MKYITFFVLLLDLSFHFSAIAGGTAPPQLAPQPAPQFEDAVTRRFEDAVTRRFEGAVARGIYQNLITCLKPEETCNFSVNKNIRRNCAEVRDYWRDQVLEKFYSNDPSSSKH